MNEDGPSHGDPVIQSTVIRWILLVVLLVFGGVGLAMWVVAMVTGTCVMGACPAVGGASAPFAAPPLLLVVIMALVVIGAAGYWQLRSA